MSGGPRKSAAPKPPPATNDGVSPTRTRTRRTGREVECFKFKMRPAPLLLLLLSLYVAGAASGLAPGSGPANSRDLISSMQAQNQTPNPSNENSEKPSEMMAARIQEVIDNNDRLGEQFVVLDGDDDSGGGGGGRPGTSQRKESRPAAEANERRVGGQRGLKKRSQDVNQETSEMNIAMTAPSETTPASQENKSLSSLSSADPLFKCRVEANLYLDFDDYKHYSCSNCYKLMPSELFKAKLGVQKYLPRNRDEPVIAFLYNATNPTIYANQTDVIRDTFRDEQAFTKWVECCSEAIKCCRDNLSSLRKQQIVPGTNFLIDQQANENDLKCPPTWDGFSCWPETSANSIAEHYCPPHVYFFEFMPNCFGRVTKQCHSNGSWYIRNDHEWSDYGKCQVITLYAIRMLIGSVWHIISAAIIGPALIVLNRLPNRGGSKRVKILSNLLFWLLLNDLLAATQKIGIINGVFHKAEKLPASASTSASAPSPQPQRPIGLGPGSGPLNSSNQFVENQRLKRASQLEQEVLNRPMIELWETRLDKALAINYEDKIAQDKSIVRRTTAKGLDLSLFGNNNNNSSKQLNDGQTKYATLKPPASAETKQNNSSAFGASKLDKLNAREQVKVAGHDQTRTRCKRGATGDTTRKQSTLIVLVCWILSLGIRITRQLGFAWMCTGAVYLCSVLHFAPAEPPNYFIKWLMILTNGFPVVIAIVYIIARTVYDRSPLRWLVQLPLYYISGDQANIDSSQLDCWLKESEYTFIEDIADFPNLILVILNGLLFVVTLIIMCRINRPGSTRPEMSLGDYFKAAGTLVLLYGAHYMLLAYRVQVEGCIEDQVMWYSTLFVDGIQGIAVSYVFCYRTSEGREIVSKWWSNCCDNWPYLCLGKRRRINRHRQSDLPNNKNENVNQKRFNNQSLRSNNSLEVDCNGKDTAGDMVTTELINIRDTPTIANRNF